MATIKKRRYGFSNKIYLTIILFFRPDHHASINNNYKTVASSVWQIYSIDVHSGYVDVFEEDHYEIL